MICRGSDVFRLATSLGMQQQKQQAASSRSRQAAGSKPQADQQRALPVAAAAGRQIQKVGVQQLYLVVVDDGDLVRKIPGQHRRHDLEIDCYFVCLFVLLLVYSLLDGWWLIWLLISLMGLFVLFQGEFYILQGGLLILQDFVWGLLGLKVVCQFVWWVVALVGDLI